MPSAALNAILFGPTFAPGATLALDFLAGKYRAPGVNSSTPDFASLPGLTVTRATPAVSWDTTGTFSFAANVARIVPGVGLLVEEARTNLFLNSFAPATQTITITAQSYTITVWGTGSVTIAAGTATISNAGSASAGSPRTIGCTVGGTITVTVTGSPSIAQVEAGTFGTSPIPTLGSSVTRAADLVFLGGITGPTQGTWVLEFLSGLNTVTGRWAAFNDNSGLYTMGPGLEINTNAATSVGFGGNGTAATTANSASANVANKAAATWNTSGTIQRVCLNGGAVAGTATLDYTGVGTVRIVLGSLQSGSATGSPNGYLRRLIQYPTQSTDAQLIALST